MAKSPRYWAALGVVLTWATALGWLVIRRTGQSDQSLIASQASLRLAPGEAWFRVMAGDVQIGYAGITLDTLANGRYRIREQVSLELPGETALIRTIRSTEYFLGAGLGVDSLISRFVRPGRRTEFRASESRSGWDIQTQGEGIPQVGRLELPEGSQPTPMAPVPLRVVPLRLALVGALATGSDRTLPVAAGWPAGAWSTTLATNGDSIAVFADSSEVDSTTGRWEPVTWDTTDTRALIVESPEGPVRLVLDARGTVISVEYPFGVRWIREEFSMARFNFRNALAQLEPAIRAQLPTLRRASSAEMAAGSDDQATSYLVQRRDSGSIETRLLMSYSTGRQRYTRGNLIISESGLTQGRTDRSVPVDPLIQLEDSAVVALAEEVTEAVTPTGFGALWTAIAKRVSVDTAFGAATDAAGAVRTGRARPEGLARLMTAVLRRHGFHARLAIGVRPMGDTLLTGAWVEAVYQSSNRWLAIDPGSGRLMSTAWIRVSHTGSAAPEDLLPLLADVRFTLLDASATEGATP
jgi:hypothetical protein